ncbi:MAG: PqqD family protein [Sphingomicrobium sp.]
MTVYKRSVDLMEAELGDELVALDPNAGDCFGFNSVATSVWRQLQEPRTFEELRDALLQEYEVDQQRCARELQELLDDMSARGLIVTAH